LDGSAPPFCPVFCTPRQIMLAVLLPRWGAYIQSPCAPTVGSPTLDFCPVPHVPVRVPFLFPPDLLSFFLEGFGPAVWVPSAYACPPPGTVDPFFSRPPLMKCFRSHAVLSRGVVLLFFLQCSFMPSFSTKGVPFLPHSPFLSPGYPFGRTLRFPLSPKDPHCESREAFPFFCLPLLRVFVFLLPGPAR